MITIRYFAGARAAAGTATECLPVPEGTTVADMLSTLSARHGEPLSRVLAASSLLLDEVTVRDRDQRLPLAATLDVLPPFAGG